MKPILLKIILLELYIELYPTFCGTICLPDSRHLSYPNKLTHYSRFQVDKNSSWNVFSSACFTEESVERVISTANGLVTGHLTVGLDSML